MAACGYCGTTILFGGVKEGEVRYCGNKCREKDEVVLLASQLPGDIVEKAVRAVQTGACPKCGGAGPVGVQTSHRVWSAIHVTSWSSRRQISCRSCGVKQKLGDAAFSLALGWWGLPWGFLATPIQVGRNLIELGAASDSARSSAQIEQMVRVSIVQQYLQSQSKGPTR